MNIMKKTILSAALSLMTVIMSAVNIPGGTRLYLTPNDNWKQAGAWFAAYYFSGETYAWTNSTIVNEEESVYEFITPEGSWDKVIFTRMDGNSQELSWDNKWNQTSDQVWDGENNRYTIAEGAWDKGDGVWSKYDASVPTLTLSVKDKVFVNGEIVFTATYGTPDNNIDATFVYYVKHTDDAEYAVVDNNTYTPSSVGEYMVKAVAEIDDKEVANAEKQFLAVAPINSEKNLYLTPNEAWKADNARFAAYIFGFDNASAWVMGELVLTEQSSIIYEFNIPEGEYTNIIFVSMKAETAEPSWESKVYQSLDLWFDGENNNYVIAEEATDKGDGEWTKYEKPVLPPVGVENLTVNRLNLVAVDGSISSDEKIVAIYTITGLDVSSENGKLPKGVYVVKTETSTEKVVMK